MRTFFHWAGLKRATEWEEKVGRAKKGARSGGVS